MHSGDVTDSTNAGEGGASFSPPGVLASSATWTFLFTDIAGSTRLWDSASGGAVESDGNTAPAMRSAVVRHEAILRTCIESRGGHFFKIVGDGVCAAFVSPRAALHAAVAAQIALLSEFGGEAGQVGDSSYASAPVIFRVRIALHTGEAKFDNDYRGSALSRVTRLLDLLHGGQIAVSETTAALLRRDSGLPPGVSLRDLGEHRLRDLTCEERVFQVCAEGLPLDFAPLRSLSVRPNNLPVQLTAFLGRDRELADVARLLRTGGSGAVRLITLTGAGGAGKTRLSLQAAASVLPNFWGGAFFVDLAPLNGVGLVLPAIAAAVGGGGASAAPTSESDLIARLNERNPAPNATTHGGAANAVLVVLDNCEHLVDECARIADRLLRACPGLRILATSREPLGVAGETAWAVPPLPLPERGRSYSLRRLTEFTAIALFVERAQSARSDFALTDANAPHVTAICCRLNGIPFALELAAAWVSTLSPSQIEAQLSAGFRLLSGGGGTSNRAALPRQKTLRATIDWSYALLTEQERILLRRLSVFAGGWTLAAAAAVCADDENETSDASATSAFLLPLDVLPALGALVLKSLVACDDACGDDNENRYRLLETIREYGGERLRAAGEGDAVRCRHLAYFTHVATEAEPHLREPDPHEWLARLDSEHDNIRAALVWSIGSGDNQKRAEIALPLAGATFWYWRLRGHIGEGRDWLARALGAAGGNAPGSARIKALKGAGILAWFENDLDLARDHLANALALCENEENAPSSASEVASLQANLGLVASSRGDFDEADAFLQQSLHHYEACGDESRVAWLLNNLAALALDRGRTDEAIVRLESCLVIQRRTCDPLSIASVLFNLGKALRLRGGKENRSVAWAFFSEDLSLRLVAGDEFGPALSLLYLSALLLEDNKPWRAAQTFGCAAQATAKSGALQWAPQDETLHDYVKTTTLKMLGKRAWLFACAEGARLTPGDWLTDAEASRTATDNGGARKTPKKDH